MHSFNLGIPSVSDYLSWDEFDDTLEPRETIEVTQENQRLTVLLAERSRLEKRLLELLGKTPPSAENARDAARFPMPIHTAQSRLDDKRASRVEEQARAAARRARERVRIAELDQIERGNERRAREQALIRAEALRRAEERAQEERARDRQNALQAQSLILERWSEQRKLATMTSVAEKAAQLEAFERHSEDTRAKAIERLILRRAEERKVAARLDARSLHYEPQIRRKSSPRECGLAVEPASFVRRRTS